MYAEWKYPDMFLKFCLCVCVCVCVCMCPVCLRVT